MRFIFPQDGDCINKNDGILTADGIIIEARIEAPEDADIFIGGRYIPGYWVRESTTSPTVFFDDQGNEIQLTRGKTFIGHFPPESLLTYGN